MPKEMTTYSISLTFRRPEDIQEVKDLHEQVCHRAGFKQANVYLAGLRHLAGIMEKAKGLVK